MRWLMTNICFYAIAANTVFREMHTCGQSYCSLLLMFGLWQVSWPGCFKLIRHDVTDQRVGCIAVVNTLLMWSSMLNHTGAIEVHVQNQLWANPQYMGVHVHVYIVYVCMAVHMFPVQAVVPLSIQLLTTEHRNCCAPITHLITYST